MAGENEKSGVNQTVDELSALAGLTDGVPQENIAFLKELINSFNDSAGKLKDTYNALQHKFEALNLQLEETNHDLSESLLEQERLSNYLTNILESLSSGVVVIDNTGVITLFNRGAELITGVPVQDAIGRHYRAVMGQDILDELTPLWALQSGEHYSHLEKNIASTDGRMIPVGFSISPLMNRSGEMIGAVEIFSDLRRIKTLEDELNRKEKLAALGQMAATMAHKIRNPLGGITGFAGLLNMELSENENGRRLVGKVIEGVDKLNRIVTSLLSYTSLTDLSRRRIDLNDLLSAILEEMSEMGELRGGVTVELHAGDGPAAVDADVEQFRDAMKSILTNAADAMENNGVIDITVMSDDLARPPYSPLAAKMVKKIRRTSKIVRTHTPFTLIAITDTGSGMDADVLAHLFVPFYTTKENGIGLGLATARKIVEAHYGEIYIESAENEGTSVGIVLPLAGVF